MRAVLSEMGRFLLVGGVGFAVDGVVLLLLIHGAGASAFWGRVPSFLVAVTATWWLHRHFTFTRARVRAPTVGEWARFAFGNTLGNGINLGLYWILVGAFGWGPLAALGLASVVAAGVNYAMSAHWVFRGR